jgi:hypothetical protein
VTFRPATGQLALSNTAELVHEFLAGVVQLDPQVLADVRSRIQSESARLDRKSGIARTAREGGF